MAVRQEHEAYLPSLLDLADRVLERAPGRRASGAIAVEAEHHLADQPEDALQVVGRRRGAERRDRVGDAGLVQAHGVHVAFDDEQPRQAARRLPALVERVELATLVEQLGLRASSGTSAPRCRARVRRTRSRGRAYRGSGTSRGRGTGRSARRVDAAALVGLAVALDDQAGPQQVLPIGVVVAVALTSTASQRAGA